VTCAPWRRLGTRGLRTDIVGRAKGLQQLKSSKEKDPRNVVKRARSFLGFHTTSLKEIVEAYSTLCSNLRPGSDQLSKRMQVSSRDDGYK